MYNDIIGKKKIDFENSIEHFKEELSKLRTGRANAGLVENLLVEYYGSRTPLKQIASINIPEPRTIAIQPWDKGAMLPIESAIRESDLGLNPNNDGIIIRINLPMLTEERRRDLVKVLNQKAEETRISIRAIREEVWKDIQKAEDDGGMSEDDKFKGKEKLQEVVDEFNKKIEEIRIKKETEIMTV